MDRKALLSMIALGLVGSAISVAAAEDAATVVPAVDPSIYGAGSDPARPFVINVTGATLMENFIKAPASTNDFLDVDGDTRIVPGQIDNLAGVLPANPYDATLWWVVQYRVVGSVNGFQELLDFGPGCAVGNDIGDPSGATTVQNSPPNGLSSDVMQIGYVNSQQFTVNGQPGGTASAQFNANNPGGMPVLTYCDGTNPVGKATYSATPRTTGDAAGGFRADVAPLDVPSAWALQAAGATVNFDDVPLEDGYGTNPRLNTTKSGATFIDPAGNPFGFKLAFAPPGVNFFNPSVTPNNLTVFDTDFAYTPVAAITNLGTGYRTITYTTQRHMLTTGRTETGENLVQVTRDTGSGTHNAYVNSFCVDPSHGVGEAIGGLSTAANEQLAGPLFIPGNKGGSSGVEATARNSRLAITYSGAERGVASSWLTAGRLEVMGVINDLEGRTTAARPSIENVLGYVSIDTDRTSPYTHVPLANRYDGYNIGGPGILATIGDPRSSLNDDTTGADIVGTDPANTYPALRNPQAAAYINNITRSTEAFITLGPDPNAFSPGEFLAQTLIINGSRRFVQDRTNPCNMVAATPIDALVSVIGGLNTLANPAYDTFGTVTLNGRTSTRQTLTGTQQYSDTNGADPAGVDDFRVFFRQSGATIAYDNTAIGNRNRVAGDFDGNGVRNWNDALELVRAYNDRINRPADRASFNNPSPTNWVAPAGSGSIAGAPGSDAIIELLGDFNADGNFGRIWNNSALAFVNDTSDVRYWADGLALDPATGRLNRMEGFARVDTAWSTVTGGASNNFFGTTLASGKTYAAGDSAGDVAGSGNFTINFQPIGHDGVVNSTDIDYVYAQFRRNPNVTDGQLNWFWGTLNPNLANLAEVNAAKLEALTESQFAVNSRNEIVGNLSADMDGDLAIDQNDIVKLVNVYLGSPMTNVGGVLYPCDVNLDRVIDTNDRAIIEAGIANPNAFGHAQGDVNGDGAVTQADLDICFPAAPVCCVGNATKTTSGNAAADVDFADISATLANFLQPANPNGTSVGDSNCDGFINFSDISTTLGAWLANCD
ncbi:MAG: hypothetical protein SFZ24_08890 [Planctomycetota bacterium]|nr:hypothetical protein [Planctomycetota bacterium]